MSKYDKMIALNKQASDEKIERARREICRMVDDGEKVTIPKLMEKTGLSRGFFYKNPVVRKEISRALEQQVGMVDPRRSILDMAMNSEIVLLRQQKEELAVENERLKKENELLRKSLAKKNIGLLKKM
ncbi:MAG: hypothetical protein E7244_27040 [Enterocloster citroniae]|nr:hypothetical protein [Enterocloster citroniae]